MHYICTLLKNVIFKCLVFAHLCCLLYIAIDDRMLLDKQHSVNNCIILSVSLYCIIYKTDFFALIPDAGEHVLFRLLLCVCHGWINKSRSPLDVRLGHHPCRCRCTSECLDKSQMVGYTTFFSLDSGNSKYNQNQWNALLCVCILNISEFRMRRGVNLYFYGFIFTKSYISSGIQ